MSRPSSPKVRRRTLRRRFRLGPTIGRIMAVLAIAVLAVIALTQSAGREAQVYKLTEMRGAQGEAEHEIADLKLLEARAKTLDRITQSQVKQEMVPVGDSVEYLSAEEGVAGAATQR